jgi:hypothetical protein
MRTVRAVVTTLVLGSAVGAFAAGCGDDAQPYKPGTHAHVGVSYETTLNTLCGVHYTYFDRRWWKASPPLDDGNGNAPPGWSDEQQDGKIKLVSEKLLRFHDDAGHVAVFRPYHGDVPTCQ